MTADESSSAVHEYSFHLYEILSPSEEAAKDKSRRQTQRARVGPSIAKRL
jgi:hypothetical protein